MICRLCGNTRQIRQCSVGLIKRHDASTTHPQVMLQSGTCAMHLTLFGTAFRAERVDFVGDQLILRKAVVQFDHVVLLSTNVLLLTAWQS